MTNAFTYVHSVAATGMRRLPSGTVSVDLGPSVGLLFDDDAQLSRFIDDLTERHRALLTAECIATEDPDVAMAPVHEVAP